MALVNNLVLSKKDNDALAEALTALQPGDKVTLTIEATIVENLLDKASFDVDDAKITSSNSGSDAGDSGDSEDSQALESSVLGVMAKKKGGK